MIVTPAGLIVRTVVVTLSLVIGATLVSSASATLLLPGATLAASPEPDPTVGGVVINSTGPVGFATANYTGTLTSSVIQGDPSNLLGGLTFTYLLKNNLGSSGEIDRLTINDFAGFGVDASYQIPATGLAPAFMTRSGLLADSGDVVGFTFFGVPFGAGVLIPGATSALLVVQTSATSYGPTLASVINGLVTSVPSLAPAVPEPCGIALTAIGLAAIASWRRRSRSRS